LVSRGRNVAAKPDIGKNDGTLNKGKGMSRIARILGLGGAMFCCACNGFPDAAPIAEAELKPEKYPTYEGVAAAPLISTEGQRFLILQGGREVLPSSALQPIAAGGGGQLSAARLDRTPYDLLYARSPDGGQQVAAEIR
jgi:hypothetical protein